MLDKKILNIKSDKERQITNSNTKQINYNNEEKLINTNYTSTVAIKSCYNNNTKIKFENEKEIRISQKTKYEDLRNLEQYSIQTNSIEKPEEEVSQENSALEERRKRKTTSFKVNKKEKKIHFDFSVLETFCKCLCFSDSK
jgi:hypothetical protein